MQIPRSLRPLAAAVLVAACSGLPTTITVGEADLQQLLERQFPLERRLLEVFEVALSEPKLRLDPEHNRLATAFDVDTRDRLFGGHWRGRIGLESGLRYEPGDQTLRLAQVSVDEVAPAGGAAPTSADRIAALVAERVLEGRVIYRVPAERMAQLQRLGLAPGAVNVTATGVEITLAAAPR